MKYKTIVADPPWRYKRGLWHRSSSLATAHYETMATVDIEALPVGDLAEDVSSLWLWTPTQHLLTGEATAVCRAWGFEPKNILVWRKTKIGLGKYLRNSHEQVILAVRGAPAMKRKNQRTDFEAPVGRHSAKPAEFFEIVETLCEGPYLELFARTHREGWDQWGKEIETHTGLVEALQCKTNTLITTSG